MRSGVRYQKYTQTSNPIFRAAFDYPMFEGARLPRAEGRAKNGIFDYLGARNEHAHVQSRGQSYYRS